MQENGSVKNTVKLENIVGRPAKQTNPRSEKPQIKDGTWKKKSIQIKDNQREYSQQSQYSQRGYDILEFFT